MKKLLVDEKGEERILLSSLEMEHVIVVGANVTVWDESNHCISWFNTTEGTIVGTFASNQEAVEMYLGHGWVAEDFAVFEFDEFSDALEFANGYIL